MKKITNRVLAIFLTLAIILTSVVTNQKVVDAMYDDFLYKENHDESHVIPYPEKMTDEDAIEFLKSNYEKFYKDYSQFLDVDWVKEVVDFMDDFEISVPQTDIDYFIGFMKIYGIPSIGSAWGDFIRDYKYNYYYDVENADKDRSEMKAEEESSKQAEIDAEWAAKVAKYEEDRKSEVSLYESGYYDDYLINQPGISSGKIKALSSDVTAVIKDGTLTINWKHKALYYIKPVFRQYFYFDIQVATNSNFTNAKTYNVNIDDVKTNKEPYFQYKIKGLEKGKTYYFKITSGFDFVSYWNNHIEADFITSKWIRTENGIKIFESVPCGTTKPAGPITGKEFVGKVEIKDGSYTVENINKKSDTGSTNNKVSVKKTKVLKATKKKSSKKLKISLKKIKGAKYQVRVYKTKKNAQKNKKAIVKKTVKKTKITIKSKKLKSKKKLYVRARAVKVVNGKKYYGKWSKVKRVKIKK